MSRNWLIIAALTFSQIIVANQAVASDYVDEDYPPPLASFGIRAGILAPYHMVNIGLSTSVVLHKFLYTEFALLYGMGLEELLDRYRPVCNLGHVHCEASKKMAV